MSAAAPKVACVQQARGMKTVDFAGHKEDVFGAFLRWRKLN